MSGTPKHVALLRGINVGGKHRLPMATLREQFIAAGAEQVETYIQSGNVVFGAPAKQAAALARAVSDALAEQLGFEVPIIVRSHTAFTKLAAAHPFADQGVEPKLMMVALLDRKPSAAKLRALDPNRSPGDLLEVRGQEVYLAFPNGVARSKLDAKWLDRSLDVVGTWRNWLTIQQLASMLAR